MNVLSHSLQAILSNKTYSVVGMCHQQGVNLQVQQAAVTVVHYQWSQLLNSWEKNCLFQFFCLLLYIFSSSDKTAAIAASTLISSPATNFYMVALQLNHVC